jgi:hypothetical protein
MRKLYVALFVAVLFSFSACNDDNGNDIEVTKMKIIQKLEKLDVPAKMKNSNNSNAKTAVSYVEQVKGIHDYFTWFDIPEDAVRQKSATLSGSDVYFWTYGGVSVWETYTESSSKYVWEVEVDMGTGRQKYIYAEEGRSGDYGFMEIYDYTSSTKTTLFRYDWTFDSKDNATVVWKDAAETFKLEIKANVDLSGSAKWYDEGKLFYFFQWNTDGSGFYKFYDENGSIALEESWSVSDL